MTDNQAIKAVMMDTFTQVRDRLTEEGKEEAFRMIRTFNHPVRSAFFSWFFNDMAEELFQDDMELILEEYVV